MITILRPLTVALLLLSATGPAWAEAVVLSSTAPGLALGKSLADDASLTLPEGAMAEILLADGEVVHLGGPFDGRIDALPQSGGSAAVEFALRGDWRNPALSVPGESAEHPAWPIPPITEPRIDASRDATWCLEAHVAPHLAAPPDQPATLLLQDGGHAAIAWPPSSGEQPWPASLPLHDGSRITTRWGEHGDPKTLRFRLIGNAGETAAGRLVRWNAAGCSAQVGPQLRELAALTAPFAVYLSTERGRTPHYSGGETVGLVAQANRPAWLYCAALQGGADPEGLCPSSAGRPG